MGNNSSKSTAKAVTRLANSTTMPYPKSPKPIPTDQPEPNYLANLTTLGQVIVPRSPTLFKPDNRMLDILKQRQAAELAAEEPTLNRISAAALAQLFDERKTISSRAQANKIAKEYGLELDVLEGLLKHVTAPSVSAIQSVKDEEDETMLAKWVDAPILDSLPQLSNK